MHPDKMDWEPTRKEPTHNELKGQRNASPSSSESDTDRRYAKPGYESVAGTSHHGQSSHDGRKSNGKPTHKRRLTGHHIEPIPQDLSEGMEKISQEAGMTPARPVLTLITRWLRENGVKHRFGGSAAAKMKGAERMPEDVDIEVSGSDNLRYAQAAFRSINGKREVKVDAASPSYLLSCEGTVGEIIREATFMAKVKFTQDSGESVIVDFDVVDENTPIFNKNLKPPKERGIDYKNNRVVNQSELIVNYLDRRLKKKELSIQKNDQKQILDIIRANGGLGDPEIVMKEVWKRLEDHISEDFRAPYQEELREVFYSAPLDNHPDAMDTSPG